MKLSADDIPGIDFTSVAQESRGKDSNSVGISYELPKNLEFSSWDDVFEISTAGVQSVHSQTPFSSTLTDTMGIIPKQENEMLMRLLTDSFGRKQEFGSDPQGQDQWQVLNDPKIYSLACPSITLGCNNISIYGKHLEGIDDW